MDDDKLKVQKLISEGKHGFDSLVEIMELLRSENGCPWDIEQTHESIRGNFIEETYEVIEAIDISDPVLLREELGDLMLQVVFHARMEEEKGVFDINDVVNDICQKLIDRHPHIFGSVVAETSYEVLKNWDKIKSEEKKRKTISSSMSSIPPSLPALMRADKIGSKAAKANFDFETPADAFKKVYEELDEVRQEMTSDQLNEEALTEEIGDLLFSVVNTARLLNIDSEKALNAASDKFLKRFSKLENEITVRGLNMQKMNMNELDLVWECIKSTDK